MFPRTLLALIALAVLALALSPAQAQAQYPGARPIARTTNVQEWNQFYHYPYVYYPQNFWSPQYFQSGQDIYNRYPPEMQVPALNRNWQNYYPAPKKYYKGNHFRLDVF